MANRMETTAVYREKLVKDLGLWAEDPRSVASVHARADRATETLSHMDRPLHQGVQKTDMNPGQTYKL